ncbi:MAG: LemA family protein [Salinivirgaceae bacterium]|nr:LemA family protein [Salinivirgaceae bacterium]
MKKKGCLIAGIAVGIILIGIISIVLWYIKTGNKIVRLDEGVSESWAQVENVYQRRADLIPNLVATVKGYAEHESSTLTDVVEARAKATSVNVNPEKLDAASLQQFEEAQGQLSSALSRLMVVVERYPDLKASQNFSELQAQLEGTENRISVERRKFNEVAREYNTYIRQFPASIVANSRGFEKKAYFEAQAGSEKAPEVQF